MNQEPNAVRQPSLYSLISYPSAQKMGVLILTVITPRLSTYLVRVRLVG